MTFEEFQASRKRHKNAYIYSLDEIDSSIDHTNYLHIEIIKDPEPFARSYLTGRTATGDVVYEAIIDRAKVSQKSLEVAEKALYNSIVEYI